MANAKTVHRLKVTLRQVTPPVWRRIEVVSDMTLSELAGTLEAAMGWMGGHLHAFDAGGTTYELPDEEGFGGLQTRDERKVRLHEVLPVLGAKLRLDYDFGDGWMHDVLVEAIEPRADGVTYPRCLAGRRACPPDDCGGPWGYTELLDALCDPLHPAHAERADWVPRGFDPTVFDVEQATEMMRSPRPLQDW